MSENGNNVSYKKSKGEKKMSESLTQKKFFGYKAVIGAFLIMFVNMGCGGTIGTFMGSLSKYTEWPVGTIGYVGTISVIGNILFSLVAARLVKTWGPRKLMGISIICTVVAMMLYTFTVPGQSVLSLVMIYSAGFIVAIAVTFGSFAVCTVLVSQWFIEKRETMTGIVLSAAAFGGSFWNFLAGQLFRFMEFKGCYRVMSVLALVIGIIAMLFFIKEPEAFGQKPLGWDKAQSKKDEKKELEGMTKAAALKTPSFWMLFAAFICVCGAGAAFVAYGQSWWQSNGFDRTTTATYYSLYVLIGGVSLMLAGKLVSKIRAAAFAGIVGLLFIGGLLFQIMLPGNPSGTMILMVCICFGLAYPLNTSMPSLVTQSVFGPKESGAIQAQLQTGVYIGQFAYSIVVGQFLKTEAGYVGAWKFFIGAVAIWAILIIGAALLSPYKPSKKSPDA